MKRNVVKRRRKWTNMVKRMFEQPRKTDLLFLKEEITPIAIIPPISNIDCLAGKSGKESTPAHKGRSRTFPGAQSSNPLIPHTGEIPRKPFKFTTLPPISQIDVLSSRVPNKERNDLQSERLPISNVPCLNTDASELKYEDFNNILPSGRLAKKDYGITPRDSEFIKLCKMNGRKNLLKEQEILNKCIKPTVREFEQTQKRTILRSPNEDWIPSTWAKFKVYGKGQLR